LSRPAPPLLIFESNPAMLRAAGSSTTSLRDQLAQFGYRCYGIEKLTDDPDAVWNILAMHPSHDRDGYLAAFQGAAAWTEYS
jgi:hypothetical protein